MNDAQRLKTLEDLLATQAKINQKLIDTINDLHVRISLIEEPTTQPKTNALILPARRPTRSTKQWTFS